MPWSNQSGGGGPWGGGGSGGGGGGGGGGQSPWGRPPRGGKQPPDVEELLRKSQERVRRFVPGGMGSGKVVVVLVAVALVAWMATGFYRVQPNEQGVALVFGKLSDTTGPGLHWNWPSPMGEVLRPAVTNVNRVEIGFRSSAVRGRSTSNRDVTEESLMLTGDENIIDIQTVVFWLISDAGKFLFNVRDPETAVKNASEAAMREIIGKTGFEFARTAGRGEVAAEVGELLQQILDEYGAGIFVQNVQIQKVDPPAAVIDAFRDVQAARADKERAINEATAYLNELTERAQGEAEQITRAAEAYKAERVAQATGDSQRFLSIYNEYINAKDVTKRRIYLQTMEEILQDMDKVLIDPGAAGSGVVPYLPLNELNRQRSEQQ